MSSVPQPSVTDAETCRMDPHREHLNQTAPFRTSFLISFKDNGGNAKEGVFSVSLFLFVRKQDISEYKRGEKNSIGSSEVPQA